MERGRFLFGMFLTVGAIHESPADAATIERENQKDQVSATTVIARRAKPDVAIRIPRGAKHRPVPLGPEGERIATVAYAPSQ